MKSIKVIVVVVAIGLGATALVARAAFQQSESVRWRKLLEQDVSTWAAERHPGDGAPGATSIGFRVSDTVQGGLLISGLDRPVLGVFVGLNTPNAFINAPYEDLRVEFVLADGSARTVSPSGGCGTAMLFYSPDDVPMSELRKVGLLVNETAEWTKSR